MDMIIIVIVQILLMLLITCIQTFFYFKIIGFSQKWRGLNLVFVILFVTVIEASLELVTFNIASFHWVGNLIFVVFILYPVIFMGGKFKEKILFGIVNLAIFMFSTLLTGSILSPERLVTYTSETSWLTMLLLSCALIVLIYAILVFAITHLNTEGKHYIPHKYWTSMIICSSIIFVGLILIYNFYALGKPEKFRTYLMLFTFVFLIIWFMSYFIFYFACQYFYKTNEANTLAIQYDMIERYMLRKQASDERVKVLSHDLKHSLTQWRLLVEEKGDANALHGILEYEEQLSSTLLINVQNESANAIINQKYLEAQQFKTEFLVDGVFYNDMIISKLDVCSLIGNLLDNAIEAAGKVESEDLRRVKLYIKRKSNILILVVENSYAIEPILENGIFVTSKKDKDHHAIGMRSIHYIAEKYNGTVNNIFENNWFKSTVMLSGYQNLLSDKKPYIQAKKDARDKR